jgi:hypothetical protein
MDTDTDRDTDRDMDRDTNQETDREWTETEKRTTTIDEATFLVFLLDIMLMKRLFSFKILYLHSEATSYSSF